MTAVEPEEFPASSEPRTDGVLKGMLHYKYMPKTGEWGEADTAYATLSPEPTNEAPPKALWRGDRTAVFHKASWEDMPTQYMIVNALHELEIKEHRGQPSNTGSVAVT